MSVLANILTDYSTLLDAVSGFAPFTQNKEPHDPDGTCHRKYIVKLIGSRRLGDLQMGGTGLDLYQTIRVEFYWDPETRESTVWTTIADDLLSIDDVMMSQSNKPTGVRNVVLLDTNIEEIDTRTIRADCDYEARFTETVTVT